MAMQHMIVCREEWTAARKALLAKEKEFTRLRDKLSAERRELPWVKVDKDYLFETLDGRKSLADLFGGCSQLIIYHFMFGPDWEEGCPGCSFLADHIDGANLHLPHHDVSVVVVSRAPPEKLEAYRRRMGWHFPWVSSLKSDFNSDYQVSFTKRDLARGETYYNYERREEQTEGEAPGISVFYKDERGEIFHTYSSYGRGGDLLIGAYNYLDLTPMGRNETGPERNMGDWMRRHDDYDADAAQSRCA
jgi:predicted dithiol-disulfide oxidoreductase (DUF899 family)